MQEEKYQSIIIKIRNVPEVIMTDDFTVKVMESLEKKEAEPSFLWRRKVHLLIHGAFAHQQTREECAISFIAASFFYFVAASALFFSLRNHSGTSNLYEWLKLQPSLFILESLWLALIGALIWTKGRKATRLAHIGSYVYILIFVIGGIVLPLAGKVELLFAVILTLGALLIGISLDAAVNRLADETKNQG